MVTVDETVIATTRLSIRPHTHTPAALAEIWLEL